MENQRFKASKIVIKPKSAEKLIIKDASVDKSIPSAFVPLKIPVKRTRRKVTPIVENKIKMQTKNVLDIYESRENEPPTKSSVKIKPKVVQPKEKSLRCSTLSSRQKQIRSRKRAKLAAKKVKLEKLELETKLLEKKAKKERVLKLQYDTMVQNRQRARETFRHVEKRIVKTKLNRTVNSMEHKRKPPVPRLSGKKKVVEENYDSDAFEEPDEVLKVDTSVTENLYRPRPVSLVSPKNMFSPKTVEQMAAVQVEKQQLQWKESQLEERRKIAREYISKQKNSRKKQKEKEREQAKQQEQRRRQKLRELEKVSIQRVQMDQAPRMSAKKMAERKPFTTGDVLFGAEQEQNEDVDNIIENLLSVDTPTRLNTDVISHDIPETHKSADYTSGIKEDGSLGTSTISRLKKLQNMMESLTARIENLPNASLVESNQVTLDHQKVCPENADAELLLSLKSSNFEDDIEQASIADELVDSIEACIKAETILVDEESETSMEITSKSPNTSKSAIEENFAEMDNVLETMQNVITSPEVDEQSSMQDDLSPPQSPDKLKASSSSPEKHVSSDLVSNWNDSFINTIEPEEPFVESPIAQYETKDYPAAVAPLYSTTEPLKKRSMDESSTYENKIRFHDTQFSLHEEPSSRAPLPLYHLQTPAFADFIKQDQDKYSIIDRMGRKLFSKIKDDKNITTETTQQDECLSGEDDQIEVRNASIVSPHSSTNEQNSAVVKQLCDASANLLSASSDISNPDAIAEDPDIEDIPENNEEPHVLVPSQLLRTKILREFESDREAEKRRVSPKSLSRQLLAEVEYQESLFESQLEVAALEHSNMISKAQQDTIALAKSWFDDIELTKEKNLEKEREAYQQHLDKERLANAKAEIERAYEAQLECLKEEKRQLLEEMKCSNIREVCIQTEVQQSHTIGTDPVSSLHNNAVSSGFNYTVENKTLADVASNDKAEVSIVASSAPVVETTMRYDAGNSVDTVDQHSSTASVSEEDLVETITKMPQVSSKVENDSVSESCVYSEDTNSEHEEEIPSFSYSKNVSMEVHEDQSYTQDFEASGVADVLHESESHAQITSYGSASFDVESHEKTIDKSIDESHQNSQGELVQQMPNTKTLDTHSHSAISPAPSSIGTGSVVDEFSEDDVYDDDSAHEDTQESELVNSASTKASSTVNQAKASIEQGSQSVLVSESYEDDFVTSTTINSAPKTTRTHVMSESLDKLQQELEGIEAQEDLRNSLLEKRALLQRKKEVAENLIAKKQTSIEIATLEIELESEEKRLQLLVDSAINLNVQEEIAKAKGGVMSNLNRPREASILQTIDDIVPPPVPGTANLDQAMDSSAAYSDDTYSEESFEVEQSFLESSIPNQNIEIATSTHSEDAIEISAEKAKNDLGDKSIEASYEIESEIEDAAESNLHSEIEDDISEASTSNIAQISNAETLNSTKPMSDSQEGYESESFESQSVNPISPPSNIVKSSIRQNIPEQKLELSSASQESSSFGSQVKVDVKLHEANDDILSESLEEKYEQLAKLKDQLETRKMEAQQVRKKVQVEAKKMEVKDEETRILREIQQIEQSIITDHDAIALLREQHILPGLASELESDDQYEENHLNEPFSFDGMSDDVAKSEALVSSFNNTNNALSEALQPNKHVEIQQHHEDDNEPTLKEPTNLVDEDSFASERDGIIDSAFDDCRFNSTILSVDEDDMESLSYDSDSFASKVSQSMSDEEVDRPKKISLSSNAFVEDNSTVQDSKVQDESPIVEEFGLDQQNDAIAPRDEVIVNNLDKLCLENLVENVQDEPMARVVLQVEKNIDDEVVACTKQVINLPKDDVPNVKVDADIVPSQLNVDGKHNKSASSDLVDVSTLEHRKAQMKELLQMDMELEEDAIDSEDSFVCNSIEEGEPCFLQPTKIDQDACVMQRNNELADFISSALLQDLSNDMAKMIDEAIQQTSYVTKELQAKSSLNAPLDTTEDKPFEHLDSIHERSIAELQANSDESNHEESIEIIQEESIKTIEEVQQQGATAMTDERKTYTLNESIEEVSTEALEPISIPKSGKKSATIVNNEYNAEVFPLEKLEEQCSRISTSLFDDLLDESVKPFHEYASSISTVEKDPYFCASLKQNARQRYTFDWSQVVHAYVDELLSTVPALPKIVHNPDTIISELFPVSLFLHLEKRRKPSQHNLIDAQDLQIFHKSLFDATIQLLEKVQHKIPLQWHAKYKINPRNISYIKSYVLDQLKPLPLSSNLNYFAILATEASMSCQLAQNFATSDTIKQIQDIESSIAEHQNKVSGNLTNSIFQDLLQDTTATILKNHPFQNL